MTHGDTSLRALAAFMVVVAVTTGTSAYISVLDEMNGSDPPLVVTAPKVNRTVEPPPPEPYVPKAMPEFTNLTFAEGFELPLPRTEPVSIVRMVRPDLDGSHGREMLERYDLYWANVATEVEVSDDWIKLRSDTRFTVISTHTGFLHYDEDQTNDKRGALVTDIETNSSLLNKTEALNIAISWLREHNLYNSSWDLAGCWSLRSGGSIANPGERIREYTFRFSPVFDGMMVHGTPEPRLRIDVTPFGQVVQVEADTAKLVVGPKTSPFTFPDPVDMLVYFDENLGRLTCPQCVRNATILSIEPAYGVGRELEREEYRSKGWPCWYVTFYVNDDDGYDNGLCL